MLTYNLYGYTTCLFSTSTQPFALTKYCIKEIEKSQNPYLYVIDIALVANTIESFTTEEIRKTTDTIL